ncbi:MAG TPA: F0F1 ATP synthase subunit A [Vicinamibacterales bacterium]|jgi:F-type H+-transporting ATPase subunit a|nr:F0F1 ATP synthase subunit A [Vicinamibacterales bacterium]
MTVCALIVSGTSRALPSCIAVRIRLFAALCFATLATVALALAGPAAAASRSTSDPAAVLQDTHAVGGAAATEEPAEHTLSQKAVEIARPFGFPITNSMVVTWLVALGLIVFARVATRSMNQVPSGAQNLLEWLIEGLYGLLESIIGAHLVKKTFWFFGSIFIFILAANWFGLIPGVGTIGWGHQSSHGFVIEEPLLRGANADLNLTLAMALIFFGCWIVWAFQEVGVRGVAKELFGIKGDATGVMKILMTAVFLAAGLLEIVSILFRPISLSFRLYGNIYAGENMLETMSRMVPGLGWLLPIPFYFMELLVGLVQALVFMLLTAVFTLLICHHEEPQPGVAHGH